MSDPREWCDQCKAYVNHGTGGHPIGMSAMTAQPSVLREREGWVLVPVEPTEEMWSGLARDIVMWMDCYSGSHMTPRNLFKHLEMIGADIPQWLRDEPGMTSLDHVPSKGTRAAIIYKAMLADAPKRSET